MVLHTYQELGLRTETIDNNNIVLFVMIYPQTTLLLFSSVGYSEYAMNYKTNLKETMLIHFELIYEYSFSKLCIAKHPSNKLFFISFVTIKNNFSVFERKMRPDRHYGRW